jgi:hypothetical protein
MVQWLPWAGEADREQASGRAVARAGTKMLHEVDAATPDADLAA